MKNQVYFFFDTLETLSNNVQQTQINGLQNLLAFFYNLFMMNKTKNKTRILVWGASLSILSYFLFAPQANIRTPKKGAK